MQTSDCRILWRTAAKKIQAFLQGSTRKELLVTGARQVGKTTLIRQLASDSSDFLLRLSALAGKNLVPGKTLIFWTKCRSAKRS